MWPAGYSEIMLNPGPGHIMKSDDICYYMSIAKEENSEFNVNRKKVDKLELIQKESKKGLHKSGFSFI